MRNKMNNYVSIGFFGLSLLWNGVSGAQSVEHLMNNHGSEGNLLIENVWSPLAVTDASGLLGERLDLYRNKRIPFLLDSGYLIDGFESRPGVHRWQGEHFGKWLHAATLEYLRTRDSELKQQMDRMVDRLLASQLENGYLGTYAFEYSFVSYPENKYVGDVTDETTDHDDTKVKTNPNGRGWDIWSHRYNLYGLLVYEKYFHNEDVVMACRKMADLLIKVYGQGTGYDITKAGTRYGMSTSTLLESMMMLYERTGDQKYLDFSLHIVDQCEANPNHRLLSTMLEKDEFYNSGDGKAYQIMANFLGYIMIYRATEDVKYLDAVVNGWNKIKAQHLLVSGGPWSGDRAGDETWGHECFARPSDFTPDNAYVEGCSDATWMQLNIHLYELTGETKYMDEAELCLFNDTLAHQGRDGVKWCYFTRPNQSLPPYNDKFHCCASSLPRGMEMYAAHMLGTTKGRLVINSLSPFTGSLGNSLGKGQVIVKSQFPYAQTATIQFSDNQEKQFDCEIRMPINTTCKNINFNGKKIAIKLNKQGNPVVSNTWKHGDVLTIEMEFLLKAKVTTGEKGKSWVAFAYGPVVLAQKLEKGAPQEEPFLGKSTGLSTLKGMLTKSAADGIAFSVMDSNVSLIPYVDAMIDNTTIVTYFKLD
jgi:hypothetical protein